MALTHPPPLPPATAARLRAMDDLLARAHEVRQRIDSEIAQIRTLLGALDEKEQGERR